MITGKHLLSIFEIKDLASEPSVEGILRIIEVMGVEPPEPVLSGIREERITTEIIDYFYGLQDTDDPVIIAGAREVIGMLEEGAI